MEIQIQNVSFTYPKGREVLSNLTLDLPASGLTGLLGPNGAGKSTLMKLLSASLLPSSGAILVNGRPLIQAERFLKAHLGYLPQGFGLFEELTPAQFLKYMAALKEVSRSSFSISQLLADVHLEDKANIPIRALSGGQRQRVGIARALAASPDILLMDEPFGAVDEITRIQLQDEILRIHGERKLTVMFVTHDIEEALKLGTRTLVMEKGRAVQCDPPSRLLAAPATEFVEQLVCRRRELAVRV